MRSVLTTIITATFIIVACKGPSGDESTPPDSGLEDAGGTGDAGGDAGASCAERTDTTFLWPHDDEPCPPGTTERTMRTNLRLAQGCGGCGCKNSGFTCAGTFDVAYGNDSSCGAGSTSVAIVDGACMPLGNLAGATTVKWPYQNVKVGTCAGDNNADPEKVSTEPIRFCVATTRAALCSALEAGQRRCDSGSACAPPTKLFQVGEHVSVRCPACICGPFGPQYSCRFEYYADAACTQLVDTRSWANYCDVLPSGGAYFKAVPNAISYCMTKSDIYSTPQASFTDAQNFCCTP